MEGETCRVIANEYNRFDRNDRWSDLLLLETTAETPVTDAIMVVPCLVLFAVFGLRQ